MALGADAIATIDPRRGSDPVLCLLKGDSLVIANVVGLFLVAACLGSSRGKAPERAEAP